MRMSVKGDMKAVQRDLGRLQKRDVPRATSAALNRSQAQILTQARRGISKARRIQQKVLKDRVVPRRKANWRNLVAEIELRYQDVPANRLKPRQLAKGVRAGRHKFEGAFVVGADQKGKKRGPDRQRRARRGHGRRKDKPAIGRAKGLVMKRKGLARLPIEKQFVEIMPDAKKITEKIVYRRGRKIFRHNFDRQVRRYLAKRR